MRDKVHEDITYDCPIFFYVLTRVQLYVQMSPFYDLLQRFIFLLETKQKLLLSRK